jgi:hypothetical protein
MGTGVLTQLSSDGMIQAPTDPLTRTQYGYSVLAFGPSAHQIRIEYEGDLVANTPRGIFSADMAYAESGIPAIVGIKGTYGGRFMAQTQTGGLVYVLAIPSIVTNTGALGGPALDIGADTLSGTLLMNASSRVGGIAYNPNKLVYTGVSLPLDDSTGQVTTLFANLRIAYSGTVLQDNRAISPIYTLTATDTPVAGPVIINNQLGKGVSLGVVASSSSNYCTAGGTMPCII